MNADPSRPCARAPRLASAEGARRLLYPNGVCLTGEWQIAAPDEGHTRGPLFYQRRFASNWKPIVRIVFREVAVSFNGDVVIHFRHPAWRTDRTEPNTAARRP